MDPQHWSEVGSSDTDPDRNVKDPQHCIRGNINWHTNERVMVLCTWSMETDPGDFREVCDDLEMKV